MTLFVFGFAGVETSSEEEKTYMKTNDQKSDGKREKNNMNRNFVNYGPAAERVKLFQRRKNCASFLTPRPSHIFSLYLLFLFLFLNILAMCVFLNDFLRLSKTGCISWREKAIF